MDARAFGALPSRTERRVSRFGRPEWLFMAAGWLATGIGAAFLALIR
ncbi:MAG TPA: hypothetical protein VF444_14530 [Pseudonocardiaceae bacterium]